jgi:hypothetical protein
MHSDPGLPDPVPGEIPGPPPRGGPVDVALVLALNALPIWGVLAGDWSIAALMVLFWLENAFAGIGIAARMLLLPGPNVVHGMKFVLLPFFLIHYGGFTAIHGVFVFTMFAKDFSLGAQPGFWWAVLAAAIVQGWQAWQKHRAYVPPQWSDEQRAAGHKDPLMARRQVLPLMRLMSEPYLRVGILHVVIVIGGMIALALGAPIAALLLLIALKIAYELAQVSGAVGRMQARMT